MDENTKIFVVDASFLLSVLLPDEQTKQNSIQGKELLIDERNIFFAPKLLEFEVLNSIKSAFLSKRIKKSGIKDILEAFEKMKIGYLDINRKEVFDLSIKNNLSFYDASYLYLAQKNKYKLLTLDKRLQKISF